MSYIAKTWINAESVYSSDFNNMETGISTAVNYHSTSTSSIHGIINLVGTTDTQTLTGKSASSSTDYDLQRLRNHLYSTSTETATIAGDILLLYT